MSAKSTKVFYHYTNLVNMKAIIESGRITRAPSNLLRPKHPRIVNGCCIDPETDDYKPVVWMTDSEAPEGLGLEGCRDSKKRIRFTIPKKPYFVKWNKWARQYNMDPQWRKALTSGMNWQAWYISELEIPLDDVSEILDLETNTVIEWR